MPADVYGERSGRRDEQLRKPMTAGLVVVAAVGLLSLSGCGSSGGAESTNDAAVAVDSVAADDTSLQAGTDDVATDTQPSEDTSSRTQPDAESDTELDAGGSTTPSCPGAVGCDCLEGGDCDTGLCLETQYSRQCAKLCVDTCPTGFLCTPLAQGADVVQACISQWARLCSPCAESKQCLYAGVADARCVSLGTAGNFCGAACTKDEQCPANSACKSAEDVDGNLTQQCVPVTKDGAVGACSCTANAVKLGVKTPCATAVVSGGKTVTCNGQAQCKSSGSPAFCKTESPKAEACDGLDNDCNGATDEGSCDDSNDCTVDVCNPQNSAQVCSNKATQTGTACDADGTNCTANDACALGKCAAGKALNCDDGNPCTKDSCDLANGCIHSDNNGVSCDDANACTSGDLCAAGGCKSGPFKSCDDNQGCTVDSCDTKTGACVFDGLPLAATPCDADGSVCTVKDACTAGKCLPGAPQNCDDGNGCTTDACDAKAGCTHLANTVVCSDGAKCTLADQCDAKVCVAGTFKICDDNELCTVDGCDDKTGACAYNALPKEATPCDADGSVCTVADACEAGKCTAGAAKVCHDNNPCTDNACNLKTGCTTANNVAKCSDNDACTNKDVCGNGQCVGLKVDCNDNNLCTADKCDAKNGCHYVQIANETLCSVDEKSWCQGGLCVTKIAAGGACKLGKQCSTGVCTEGVCCDGACSGVCRSCLGKHTGAADGQCKPVALGKDPDEDCKTMNVATCANTGVCDGAGQCQRYSVGTVCEAASCANGSHRAAGLCGSNGCVKAKFASCNDNNGCTTDTCDQLKGCQLANNVSPCDADADECTQSDTCADSKCKAGTKKVCNDANPCTTDGCDSKTGKCTTTALKDATPCGSNKVCAAGKCVQDNPAYLGTGKDGKLVVTKSGTVINAYTHVTGANVAKAAKSLTVKSTAAFGVGDEVLILQTQAANTAGTYEHRIVASKSGKKLTFERPLNNAYSSAKFNASSSVAAQVIRVPNYSHVTVNSGASISAKSWDGYVGGVVVFRATGDVKIGGSVTVVGKGYRRGPTSGCGKHGHQGEGYRGKGSVGTAPNYGGGGGSTSAGFCGDSGAGGSGGGGYGAKGQTGKACGNGCGSTQGGKGGDSYGSTDLTKLFFGGASGADGRDNNCGDYGNNGCVACGSNGGGIVRIVAQSIAVTGSISANGAFNGNSSGQDSPGPSAGAGGSVHLSAKTMVLGSGKITSLPGAPGKTHWCPTGPVQGAVGRARLDADSLTGDSNPAGFKAKFVPTAGFSL